MREPKDEVAFLGSPLLGERVSDYYSAMLSRHLVLHGWILLLIGAMVACGGKSGEAEPVEAGAGHEKPKSSSGATPDGEPLAALSKADAPASKLPPPRLKTPSNTAPAREHSSPGVRVQPVQVARKTRPGSGSSEPEKPDSRKGKPKRWLGLSVANLEEPIEGAPETARAIVRRAHRGGPGYKAGLRRDDVIVTADGVPVSRYQDYLAQAKLREVGDSLPLEVLRSGNKLRVDLTIVEQPKNSKAWRREHFPGTPAVEWSAPSLRPSGTVVSMTGEEKPELIYFWATWCGPCRRTSPQVDAFHREFGERVSVVAISSEERDVLDPFLAKSQFSYPVIHDVDGLIKFDYEVASLPTIVWTQGNRVMAWDYGVGGVSRVVNKLRASLQ